jgi:anti-sigma factor RsiW
MRCTECQDLFDAHLDGELMPNEAEAVATHLAQCADCARAYAAIAATSRRLQDGLVRYSAPDVLKARIRSAIAQPERPLIRSSTASARWGRLLAAGFAIAVASSAATFAAVRQSAAPSAVADEVLTSHVRSLMPGHLTDVISNNQHNVKPWFNGRVNLSPPVPALDSAGFVLVGGRVDYVANHTVAVVVYARRQHIINVFSWPEVGQDAPVSLTAAQGYHLVRWRTGDVAVWIVSDLNGTELRQFMLLYQGGAKERE